MRAPPYWVKVLESLASRHDAGASSESGLVPLFFLASRAIILHPVAVFSRPRWKPAAFDLGVPFHVEIPAELSHKKGGKVPHFV